MDEDNENVAENDVKFADSEVVGTDDETSGKSVDYGELSAMVDANGQKIDGLALSVDAMDAKIDKAGEELHALKTAQESKATVDDVYTDIATLASYQTLLLVVIGAFVALSVGIRIATFFFSYLRDR